MALKMSKKIGYDTKLYKLLNQFSDVLVVAADNVGSNQFHNIRRGLLGDSVVVKMGKNTMLKRTVDLYSHNTGNGAFRHVIPTINGKVGLMFSNGELDDMSEEVAEYKLCNHDHDYLWGSLTQPLLPFLSSLSTHPRKSMLLQLQQTAPSLKPTK